MPNIQQLSYQSIYTIQMNKFHHTIKAVLQSSHSQEKKQTQSLVITHIHFQKLCPLTQVYLEQYKNVKLMCLTYCDLRTLQNFPLVQNLIDLDLSNNSLQGTFEYLLKNKKLEYINVQKNFVSQLNKLMPLKRFRNISIFLKDNPIYNKDGWKLKLKQFHIKLLTTPKKIINEKQKKQQIVPLPIQSPKKIQQKVFSNMLGRIDQYGQQSPRLMQLKGFQVNSSSQSDEQQQNLEMGNFAQLQYEQDDIKEEQQQLEDLDNLNLQLLQSVEEDS